MLLAFKKYFFATLVLVYLVMVSGIPVYQHYCGGELEEVNYLVKTSNCCGEEAPEDDDCCKDQQLVLISNADATLSQVQKNTPEPASLISFAIIPSPINLQFQKNTIVAHRGHQLTDYGRQTMISTTVLRI